MPRQGRGAHTWQRQPVLPDGPRASDSCGRRAAGMGVLVEWVGTKRGAGRGSWSRRHAAPSFTQNLYESIKNEPFKIPEDDGNDLTHTFFNPDREGWLLKLGEWSLRAGAALGDPGRKGVRALWDKGHLRKVHSQRPQGTPETFGD